MKKMRKIIPALAMLLISAVMMSTASFAWFSMNTNVTASGMSVKAKSDGGLAIASYTGTVGSTATAPVATAFSTSANAADDGNWLNGTGDLFPTSTADTTAWYSATAANVNAYNPEGDYATVAENEGAKYYRLAKFQVKSLDEGTETAGSEADLYVTAISVTGGANSVNLNKALRVAIVNADNEAFFFAPVYSGTEPTVTDFRYVGLATDATDPSAIAYTAGGLTFINCDSVAAVQILDGKLNTTAQDVSVYVYYEGEDDNCYSLNAVDIDTLSVTVTFSTLAN